MNELKFKKLMRWTIGLCGGTLYYFLLRVSSGIVLADGVGSDDLLRGSIALGFLILVGLCVMLYVFID